jgi:glycosyltransferase involved in cell wall biosynthesis
MPKPEVIVVNISNSGSRLGGAAIAAQWHSQFMAKKIPLELWRMWDKNESLELDGLRIRNFISRPKFGFVGKKMPKLAQKVFLESDILSELAIDPPKILHLQNPSPALELERIALTCKNLGTKIVTSTHGFQEIFYPQYGFDKFYQKYGWDNWLIKPLQRSFKYIDAFLLGYPTQKDLLLSNGVPESKLHLIPNGIDPFFTHPPTQEECQATIDRFSLNLDRPLLLFIGNHTANKGLDTLIELAACLSIPATVVVGGRLLSPDEPAQRLQSKPPAPHINVIFTDYLSTIEQRVLYHLSTLLLFPSLSDTLPLTILEAMGAGLPVVAYDVGGIQYQLSEGAGVVVPAGDFPAFLDATEKLLIQPNILKEMEKVCKIRQQKLFSWDLIADKTVELYHAMI